MMKSGVVCKVLGGENGQMIEVVMGRAAHLKGDATVR